MRPFKLFMLSKYAIFFISLFSGIIFFAFAQPDSLLKYADKESCFTVEERTVRGVSLEPLIKPGQTVKIMKGYYNCYPVERNDIVIYIYAGNKNPIIKVVKGIPGDTFHIVKNKDKWQLVINGKVATNSENIPYEISERAYKMLSLYEKEYNGIIPPDTYLLLGNQIRGTLDSRIFGLVDKKDILGKVKINER